MASVKNKLCPPKAFDTKLIIMRLIPSKPLVKIGIPGDFKNQSLQQLKKSPWTGQKTTQTV